MADDAKEPDWALIGVIAQQARNVRALEAQYNVAEKARADYATEHADLIDKYRELERIARGARSRFDSARESAFDAICWALPKDGGA